MFHLNNVPFVVCATEKSFKIPKWVIRNGKSKVRQHNGHKKNDKKTYNQLQNSTQHESFLEIRLPSTLIVKQIGKPNNPHGFWRRQQITRTPQKKQG